MRPAASSVSRPSAARSRTSSHGLGCDGSPALQLTVFSRLVAREADWLPPWHDLLRCLRRLEARGDVRGGRFVACMSGEQFAAPEAIGLLRDMRRREPTGALLSLSGADPLNLVGVLTPGARLPALRSNRVLYRDGVPIALLAGGDVRFPEQLAPPTNGPRATRCCGGRCRRRHGARGGRVTALLMYN
jgi:hypothetical protein